MRKPVKRLSWAYSSSYTQNIRQEIYKKFAIANRIVRGAEVFAIAKHAGFIEPRGSKNINTTTKGFVLIKSLAFKIRKALVIATSAAVALTGLTATPAAAAADFAAANAFAYVSGSVSTDAASNDVTLPEGASSISFNRQFNLGADFFTNNVGKKITLKTSITGPDGTVLGAGYSIGGSPSFRFCVTNGACDFSTWDKSELVVKNTHTNGSISAFNYVNRQSNSMSMMSQPEPLPAGKYTISTKIQSDGVDVAVDEVQTNIVTGWGTNSYSIEGSTITPAAAAININFFAQMCVDSAKLQVGDVVTPELYINDQKKNLNGGMTRFETRDGSAPNPRMGGNSSTATVTQDDIDFGLAAGINTNQDSITAGSPYALKAKLLDQDGNDVSGDCAPAAPSKPTINAQGQTLTVSPGAVKFGDMVQCDFYSATDLTKVLKTSMAMSNMPNTPETCSYDNAPGGVTYVVKTTGFYAGVPGPQSEASDPVLVAAPGYTLNPAVSGGDKGGDISVVSNSVSAVSGATSVRLISDSTGALRLSTVSQSVQCPPCGASSATATLEKTTTNGLSSTFAGTGSVTMTTAGGSFPNAAWYGAGDKWTLAGQNITFGGNGSTFTYKLMQGTYGAAATTSLEVAASVFEATCSSLGAGYTTKPNAQSISVLITPISAPTAKQLYNLSCYKPTALSSTTTNLVTPVIVTIDNATTVNVVKVLGENSNVANATNTAFSASNSASGTATALTIFVTKRLITDIAIVNNMTTESGSIASREIVRVAADLSSTTTANGWVTSGTTLANEPAVIVPQINDGSFYVMQRVASADFKLMKVTATGAASTAVSITHDKAADMVNYNLSWPAGLQSGSLANVSVQASTATKLTMLSVNTTTGAGKASEIASYVVSPGVGLFSATVVDAATKDVSWWFSNTAADTGKISIYKWRDPMFVKPVGPVPAVTSKNLEYATNTPAAGTKVTFTGTNLDLATAVKFGTVAATLGTKTATSLEVTVPAGTGTVAITIESANGNGAGGNFTYVGATKVAQTVTLDAGANTATVGDADRTLSATVAMTGYTAVPSLTYSSTTASVCTVTGTKLKFVNKGTCSVKATQAGSSWTAEGVATKDITVAGPDAQTITIKAPSAGEKLIGPDGFFVYPSTNSGQPLSIRFDTPSVCKKGTFAANHVINVKTGTCKVTVSAAGNAQWAAGSSTLTYTVGKAGTTAITDAGNVNAPVILNGNGTKTNVLSEVVSWKKSTGALTVSSRGVWVGPITATATFKIGSKSYTCSLKYGTLKAASATSVKGFPATSALCGGSSSTDKAALAALKKITEPVVVKIVVVRELRDPAKYATKGQKVTRAVYVTIG